MSSECDIDLSFLRGRNTVINLRTQEEADLFCGALDEQFPGVTWSNARELWSRHKANTCYRIDYPELGHRMNYDQLKFYENCGYDIVLFSSICTKPDFGEIDAEFIPLSSLLEVGVYDE